MAIVNWVGTLSANWSTGSDWSTGAPPQTGDEVFIETNSTLTVTYNTGTLFLDSIYTSVATLDITAGTLGVSNGGTFVGALELGGGELRLAPGTGADSFGGNVSQTGGTMLVLGGAIASGGTFSETGGTLAIGNGVFTDQDQGTFTSLITGDGRLLFDAPVIDGQQTTITLGSGFASGINGLEIVSLVALDSSLTFANNFALDASGTVDLDGNTLKLTGNAGLDGTITDGGTVDASGTGHLNGLLLDNGVDLSLTGTYNESGAVTLGSAGSGTLSIGTSGVLRLINNSIIAASSGGDLMNDGVLAKVGGGSTSGESIIEGDFTNASTGTIDIARGILDFRGPSNGFTNTLAGTITGPGTVSFDAGDYLIDNSNHLALNVSRLLLTGSATMTLTTALSYAGDWDQISGTLVVGSPGQVAGSLTLTGETAFDGGLLKGTGTVLATGAVNLGDNVDLEGNLQFTFDGPVSQTSTISLGLDADAITIASIAKGNSWDLKGDASIIGFNAQIDNAGTFAMVSGAGTSIVQSGLINTGTLAADSGALVLSGVGTLGGSVVGSAVLDISGAYEFASGLSLSVGTVILDAPNQADEIQASLAGNLTFANNWAQEGGTVSLLGNTLTLHGVTSLQAGAIEGPGELLTTGAAVLGNGFSLLQGAEVMFDGNTQQTGNVTLTGGSEAPTLTVGTDGTYTMMGQTALGGPNGSIVGTVVVDGTFVASGVGENPSPSNVIAAALVDNGKIALSYGEMQFLSSLTGTGSITLSNGATLQLLGSTSVTNAITFGSGGGILDLGTPSDYTGKIIDFATGDMVELGGFTFSAGISTTILGDTVTLTEESGQSATLTFSSAQTLSQLTLGEGPHGNLALIHL
jgi:hypothetical protein